MFHHFHDGKKHKKTQGSISKNQFYKIIKLIGKKNILNPEEFLFRLERKKLKKNHVCLTFDDAIKSQFDIAVPVLEDLKIKSFFFVYSSLFERKPDFLEVYRFFRNNYFKNINQFYDKFYKYISSDLENFFKKKSDLISLKKKQFSFYSIEDIKFRLVKNFFLKKESYDSIMKKMFKDYKFKPEKYFNRLFFDQKDVKRLFSLGHTIGLHSHNHPTLIENLSFADQKKEYEKNLKSLCKLLRVNETKIFSMSHPCGSYNYSTLKILKNLNIRLGFKQMMNIEKSKGMKKINNSNLEIARRDHTDLMRYI